METLQRSKGMSAEIHKRVAQSEDTEKLLSVARKKYLPVSGPNYMYSNFSVLKPLNENVLRNDSTS